MSRATSANCFAASEWVSAYSSYPAYLVHDVIAATEALTTPDSVARSERQQQRNGRRERQRISMRTNLEVLNSFGLIITERHRESQTVRESVTGREMGRR